MSEQGSTIKLTYEETKKLKKVLKEYLHRSDLDSLRTADEEFEIDMKYFALKLLSGLFE